MRFIPALPPAGRLIGAALALAVASSAPGCAERPRTEQRPDLPKIRDEPEPPRPVIAVRKIIAFPSGEVLGYLKVHEDNEPVLHRDAVHVFWVYDAYFKVLGFYTERGATFRVLKSGEFQELGNHDVDDSKRILLGKPREYQLELAPMDAPRTLEADAEAARQKAAAAAAAKDKPAGAEGGAPPTAKP